jgi:transcriptional regulator with XRE-family HTH domain
MAQESVSLSPKEVGARIKAARLLRGVSQDELAHRLARDGMAFRMVGQLERGSMEIRPAHVRALCVALGFPERWFTVPLDEFFNADVISELDQARNDWHPMLEEILVRLRRIESQIGGDE